MKVYKAYSIVHSSLFEKSGETKEIRIDWKKATPDFNDDLELDSYYRGFVENYDGLKESGEDMGWVEERLDYFLSAKEVNRLKEFIYVFLGIPLQAEEYTMPVPFKALKNFQEKSPKCFMINHNIELTDDEKQEWEDVLDLWYVGLYSGFKGMDDIKTVAEFLKEMRT